MFTLIASEWHEPVGDGEYVRHVRGDVVDVPDEHRARLLKARAIKPVSNGPDPAAEATPEPAAASVTAVEESGAEEEAAPDRPLRTASKATWVDYAVDRGFDRTEAEGMTRAELIDALGE